MSFRDRIIELRRVRAADLHPSPRNWREHSQAQRAALQAMLDEVGWAGATLTRTMADGSLELIDGHLRAGMDPDEQVPVLVTDLTEEEADKLLLTVDPIAAMATADQGRLAGLIESVQFEHGALDALIETMKVEHLTVDLPPLTDEFERAAAQTNGYVAAAPEQHGETSAIRMVQLFFNDTSFPTFSQAELALRTNYDTHTITDTVLLAVMNAAARVKEGA